MFILTQTISTNLTVKSVQNSTCALPDEYLPVMKNFRSIHAQKVSLQRCLLKERCCIEWWVLLFCGLYRTYFKSENWGLSGQMKIWQLTFLDSAYSKYESKLKLPLLPKKCPHICFLGLFLRISSWLQRTGVPAKMQNRKVILSHNNR